MTKGTVLIAEDEESIRFFVRGFFTSAGFTVRDAHSVATAVESFRAARPDVAVVDHCLPDGTSLDLLRALREIDPLVPVIVLTAHGSIDLAVQSIKEGAEQFLTKPLELPALLAVVERALENQRNRQVRMAGRSRSARLAVDPFLGDSPAVRRLAERARKVVVFGAPVLIQGETGTGKGVVANWLHAHGPRAEEAFVDLNCAGLSADFLETELFGHERGAFTGATTSKSGLLEIAHRGTLFLDELADMDLGVQPKLLKVLEDQQFRRLGDVRDRQVDVRLIAGTHRDLRRMVDMKEFREDLFYRINTIPLVVPPLRERGADILLIARALLTRLAADLGRPGLELAPDAEDILLGHSWPGNIRELRNALERAVLLGDDSAIRAHDLTDLVRSSFGPPVESGSVGLSLDAAERLHIMRTLEAQEGNVARAAQILGLSRSALYKKLKVHERSPSGQART